MIAQEPLLKLNDLRTYFFSREGTLKAVDGVSFTVREGEVLGVIGESGCGKSVTSQSILRIVPGNGRIVSGEILLKQNGGYVDLAKLNPKGKQIRAIRGRDISMVFQEPMTSFSPVYTVGNQIMEVIRLHHHSTEAEARESAVETLRLVGMPKPEINIDAYPFHLSGGMRQRAMIAMALCCRPRLLIADEPTSAVDVTIQAQILKLLKRLQSEFSMTVMIVTHDLGVVADFSDTVMIMYLGMDVEYGTAIEIFENPLHPYTKGLLASIPRLGQKSDEDLVPIEGNVPSLYERPDGCPFYTRCPSYMPGTCDAAVPAVTEPAAGRRVRCYLYSDKRVDES